MGGHAPRKQLCTQRPAASEVVNEGPSDSLSPDEAPVNNSKDAEGSEASPQIGEKRKPKRDMTRRTRGRPETRRLNSKRKSAFHHDLRVYEEAERNQAHFASFSLIEQIEMWSAPPSVNDAAWVLWDDTSSRTAVDCNGIPVLYHFAKLIREDDAVEHTNACLRVAEKMGLDSDGPGSGECNSTYVFAEGEVSGRIDFAHAVAPKTKHHPILPSRSFLENLEPLKAYLMDTEFLCERVNSLINIVDPALTCGLENLQEKITNNAEVQELATVDPMLMESHAIVFNHKALLHANTGDFEAGWRVLISLGSFTEGGYVRIPRLGLRVRFLPGDMLVLRGAFLEFEVEAWSGGQKVCLESFTRGDLWRHAEVGL